MLSMHAPTEYVGTSLSSRTYSIGITYDHYSCNVVQVFNINLFVCVHAVCEMEKFTKGRVAITEYDFLNFFKFFLVRHVASCSHWKCEMPCAGIPQKCKSLHERNSSADHQSRIVPVRVDATAANAFMVITFPPPFFCLGNAVQNVCVC